MLNLENCLLLDTHGATRQTLAVFTSALDKVLSLLYAYLFCRKNGIDRIRIKCKLLNLFLSLFFSLFYLLMLKDIFFLKYKTEERALHPHIWKAGTSDYLEFFLFILINYIIV